MTTAGGDILTIDGAMGEGGGQILRSSLALSMITGRAIRIINIRANREKPGLQRQHLTAVQAAARVNGATVVGAELNAHEITFHPHKTTPGEYTFDIGSAGSTTLVLQTILPALLVTRDGVPSTITLIGGTHNFGAPPLDFLERAFVPLINHSDAWGDPLVSITMERAGFVPRGGGRVVVRVDSQGGFLPFDLIDRGALVRKKATATVAGLDESIARRELDRIAEVLGWSEDELEIRRFPDAWGPGNIVTIAIESEHVTEVFTGFGQRGVRAEHVAERAALDAKAYLDSSAPVGECLADQLLLPLALAGGGSFVTSRLTLHATTNIEVIRRFLPNVQIKTTPRHDGTSLIEVTSS